jgi:hypothetical protein
MFEQWRHDPLFMGFLRTRAASYKPVAQPQLMVGPTNKKLLLLRYQTTVFVAAGKPHPQPQYQTTPKSLKNKLYLHNLAY